MVKNERHAYIAYFDRMISYSPLGVGDEKFHYPCNASGTGAIFIKILSHAPIAFIAYHYYCPTRTGTGSTESSDQYHRLYGAGVLFAGAF